MMPLYEIHSQQLAHYQERAKRGEIIIFGMTRTANGYRLDVKETPRLADALGYALPTPIPQPKPPEPPKPKVGAQVMLECPHCTNPLNSEGVCEICNRMAAIAEKAAVRRKAWHEYKAGRGPKPL